MEIACQPANPEDVLTFQKNTRSMSNGVILYTASIDQAWAPLPNHERISHDSFRILQVSCYSYLIAP